MPEKKGPVSYVGYGVGCTLALVFLFVAFITFPLVQGNFESIEAVSNITVDLRRTFSLIQDAETGQRGFLLTGKDEYLAPFNAA